MRTEAADRQSGNVGYLCSIKDCPKWGGWEGGGVGSGGGGDAAEEKQNKLRSLHQGFHILINISFSDPDPYWIRIQWPFGSVPGQELKKTH